MISHLWSLLNPQNHLLQPEEAHLVYYVPYYVQCIQNWRYDDKDTWKTYQVLFMLLLLNSSPKTVLFPWTWDSYCCNMFTDTWNLQWYQYNSLFSDMSCFSTFFIWNLVQQILWRQICFWQEWLPRNLPLSWRTDLVLVFFKGTVVL